MEPKEEKPVLIWSHSKGQFKNLKLTRRYCEICRGPTHQDRTGRCHCLICDWSETEKMGPPNVLP